ncbi:rhophilin-1-like [Littorina saxatilis]|uniref:Rhophilin-2 n=1 Tax=Littorina saxatilis TaxID=31220 RepID=A0AAN9BZU1_9CAEN
MSLPHKSVVAVVNGHDRHGRKGSDPLVQTARGKLQTRRSKLNEQINKELRMRTGAENLYRATGNKKLKEQVAVELSFFNSNIQLLKEELSEMNSSMEVYQHDNCAKYTPMIPLGLKETKELDFSVPFTDVIMEHYSEPPENYTKEINDLNDLRQAIRTPERNYAGIELLTEYFNQLYFVEKRFFRPNRQLPLHFHWYDSLTGVPSIQKAIGFEKGSILFNVGSLYTQMGCRRDRTRKQGVTSAREDFERAAGSFRYLESHFRNAPSMDMQSDTLSMLSALLLAQAQECVLEGRLMEWGKEGVVTNAKLAREAAMVSEKYRDTHRKMTAEVVKSYLPFPWVSMAQTKHYFYKGLAHYYVAMALMEQKDSGDTEKLRAMFESLHVGVEPHDENNGLKLPKTHEERKVLGKGHLREAVLSHEEALRVHDLCKQMRKIDLFRDILQKMHERSVEKFSGLEEEDDFTELMTVPRIVGKSEQESAPIAPDFSKTKSTDIFWKLGPIAIFNSKNQWSAPRAVVLQRQPTEGFGFSVRGDSPVIVADIEPDSVAGRSGMKVGDFVVGVATADTKWAKHEEVVQLVRQAGSELRLTLITPMEINLPEVSNARPFNTISLPTSPVNGKLRSRRDSASSDRSNRSRLSAPWIFRRTSSRDKADRVKNGSEDTDTDTVSR